MPEPRRRATTRKSAAPAGAAPKEPATAPAAAGVCPRCGTARFAAEERTRVEGRRTVRTTVLVCERGHTFARPKGAR